MSSVLTTNSQPTPSPANNVDMRALEHMEVIVIGEPDNVTNTYKFAEWPQYQNGHSFPAFPLAILCRTTVDVEKYLPVARALQVISTLRTRALQYEAIELLAGSKVLAPTIEYPRPYFVIFNGYGGRDCITHDSESVAHLLRGQKHAYYHKTTTLIAAIQVVIRRDRNVSNAIFNSDMNSLLSELERFKRDSESDVNSRTSSTSSQSDGSNTSLIPLRPQSRETTLTFQEPTMSPRVERNTGDEASPQIGPAFYGPSAHRHRSPSPESENSQYTSPLSSLHNVEAPARIIRTNSKLTRARVMAIMKAHRECSERRRANPLSTEKVPIIFRHTRGVLGDVLQHHTDTPHNDDNTMVPVLGKALDDFVDLWGFTTDFIMDVYKALLDTTTVTEFALQCNHFLSIAEATWVWAHANVKKGYTATRLRNHLLEVEDLLIPVEHSVVA